MINWKTKKLLEKEDDPALAASALTELKSNYAYRLLMRCFKKQADEHHRMLYRTIDDPQQQVHHNRNVCIAKTCDSVLEWERALMEELTKRAQK